MLYLCSKTKGLDARAALLVMNALRKIASTGRTVVATIHQPSSTVFDMFDDLLLLKKGGEVVFYGQLGHCSSNLIEYFESLGVTPMNKGENPASESLRHLSYTCSLFKLIRWHLSRQQLGCLMFLVKKSPSEATTVKKRHWISHMRGHNRKNARSSKSNLLI